MPKLFISTLCLTLALLFGGCVQAPRVPSSGLHKQAPSTQMIIGLAKPEIGTSIDQSNITASTGGGLIPFIIDSSINNSRAKKAEGAVGALRDALLGYDLGTSLANALHAEMDGEAWVKDTVIQIKPEAELGDWTELAKNATADQVVTLRTNYVLTPDFKGIKVTVTVAIQPHSGQMVAQTKVANKDLMKNADAIYFNTFAATVLLRRPPIMTGAGLADWATAWAADNGKEARSALDRAATEIVRMIAWDLTQPGSPDQALYSSSDKSTERTIVECERRAANPRIVSTGYLVHKEGNHEWIRMPSGELRVSFN